MWRLVWTREKVKYIKNSWSCGKNGCKTVGKEIHSGREKRGSEGKKFELRKGKKQVHNKSEWLVGFVLGFVGGRVFLSTSSCLLLTG